MSIGKMRHRITVQVWSQVTDPGGGLSESWDDELTTWASIKPLASRRVVLAEQVQISEGFSIVLRWANGRIMDKKRRVVYGSQVLTISGVKIVDEAKRFFQITCLTNE